MVMGLCDPLQVVQRCGYLRRVAQIPQPRHCTQEPERGKSSVNLSLTHAPFLLHLSEGT